MNIYELSPEQMEELKEKLFYGCYEVGNLDIEERAELDGTRTPDSIPDTLVYSAFSGYTFVNDDFFCTAEH